MNNIAAIQEMNTNNTHRHKKQSRRGRKNFSINEFLLFVKQSAGDMENLHFLCHTPIWKPSEFSLSNKRLNQPFYCFFVKLCGFLRCFYHGPPYFLFSRCSYHRIVWISTTFLRRKIKKYHHQLEETGHNTTQMKRKECSIEFRFATCFFVVVIVYRLPPQNRKRKKNIPKPGKVCIVRLLAHAFPKFLCGHTKNSKISVHTKDYKKMHNFVSICRHGLSHAIATTNNLRRKFIVSQFVVCAWCFLVAFFISGVQYPTFLVCLPWKKNAPLCINFLPPSNFRAAFAGDSSFFALCVARTFLLLCCESILFCLTAVV